MRGWPIPIWKSNFQLLGQRLKACSTPFGVGGRGAVVLSTGCTAVIKKFDTLRGLIFLEH